ncbi:MAG: hypothetical protein ACOCYW_05460 [Roseicyclus sp.]
MTARPADRPAGTGSQALPELLTDEGRAEAIDIFQAHLDVSTRLVVDGAAEAYVLHAQLPYIFRTAEGIEVIETAAGLADDARRVRDWLASKGVTDFHRIARSARYLDAETIEGFHMTYALHGAIQTVDPYASRMILRRVGGMWKTCYAEHELSDGLYPGRDARAAHGLFAESWARAPSAPTRDQAQALPLYRDRIEAMAEAVNARAFDRVLALYDLPYHLHDDTGDTTVDSEVTVRRHLDLFLKICAGAGADTIRNTASSAAFLSDERLVGYHETRLMRGGEVRFGPIRSRSLLILKDGDWRVKSVANAISTAAAESGKLELSPGIPTLRDIEKRTKT